MNVRLAENHEQVAATGLFQQFLAHRQVGIHPGGQDHQLAVAFGLFGDVRIEDKATDNEQHSFFGGKQPLLDRRQILRAISWYPRRCGPDFDCPCFGRQIHDRYCPLAKTMNALGLQVGFDEIAIGQRFGRPKCLWTGGDVVRILLEYLLKAG